MLIVTSSQESDAGRLDSHVVANQRPMIGVSGNTRCDQRSDPGRHVHFTSAYELLLLKFGLPKSEEARANHSTWASPGACDAAIAASWLA